MNRRGWSLVIVVATVLALVSLASNVTTISQLEGKANTLLASRLALSQLVNAGTVWAGLAVASGWLVRRPAPAVAAGIVALLTACIVHYGAGLALGMFDPDVWAANSHWLMAAMALGGPLGLVGAIARRMDLWGTAARLIVPVGAVLEPFYLGRFTTPAILPWPNRVADVISGLALLTTGVAGCFGVLATGRRRKATHGQRATAEA